MRANFLAPPELCEFVWTAAKVAAEITGGTTALEVIGKLKTPAASRARGALIVAFTQCVYYRKPHDGRPAGLLVTFDAPPRSGRTAARWVRAGTPIVGALLGLDHSGALYLRTTGSRRIARELIPRIARGPFEMILEPRPTLTKPRPRTKPAAETAIVAALETRMPDTYGPKHAGRTLADVSSSKAGRWFLRYLLNEKCGSAEFLEAVEAVLSEAKP